MLERTMLKCCTQELKYLKLLEICQSYTKGYLIIKDKNFQINCNSYFITEEQSYKLPIQSQNKNGEESNLNKELVEKPRLGSSTFMQQLLAKMESNYKKNSYPGDVTTRGIQNFRQNFQKAFQNSQKNEELKDQSESTFQIKSPQTQRSGSSKRKPLIPFSTKPVHTENSSAQANKVQKFFSSDILDNLFDFKLPIILPSKYSQKSNGIVKAFAANTHNGLVRTYNEDRVSIILNILKPMEKILHAGQIWPNCCFFGIYDGHGGNKCAEYLKEHLHHLIISSPDFPSDPVSAIKKACFTAEEKFIKQCQESFDKSGSCATFALMLDNQCYCGNVGDSRIIIVKNEQGNEICEQITNDHKPEAPTEQSRIIKAGGYVYQTQGPMLFEGAQILGPKRVFPGRLSVSRSFGDIEAKLPEYNGIQGVVVAEPEIHTFQIQDSDQYMMLGCDGIFDKLINQEVQQIISKDTINAGNFSNIHEFCGRAAANVLKTSMKKKSLDNVTVVVLALKGLKKSLDKTNYGQTTSFSSKIALAQKFNGKKTHRSLTNQQSSNQ